MGRSASGAAGALANRLNAIRRRNALLPEIESYLARTGMAASTFSLSATGDSCFVQHLRWGWSECGKQRAKRVRLFMAANPQGGK